MPSLLSSETLVPPQFHLFVSPTLGNAREDPSPWLDPGFASQSLWVGSPVTHAWRAAGNLTQTDNLLGISGRCWEPRWSFTGSSYREHDPRQGLSPHGKVRFSAIPLSRPCRVQFNSVLPTPPGCSRALGTGLQGALSQGFSLQVVQR